MHALSPSTDRFFPGVATDLDVVAVEYIKDLNVFFEAFADLGLDDGGI